MAHNLYSSNRFTHTLTPHTNLYFSFKYIDILDVKSAKPSAVQLRTWAAVHVPSLGLLSEMAQIVLVFRMQHLLVGNRDAHFGVVLEEIFVAALQQVNLGVVQRGVLLLVPVAVFLP